MDQPEQAYEEAAREVVELGNRMTDDNPDLDLWDVSDGLLAGAVHYWLYSHQPCGDSFCEDCETVSTADLRMAELMRQIKLMAEESDYYHSPTDSNVGRA